MSEVGFLEIKSKTKKIHTKKITIHPKMSRSKFVSSVIHGAKQDSAFPLSAAQQSAKACGTETTWLGSTDEEKALVSSWVELCDGNKDVKLLLGSFRVSPFHFTYID